MDKKQTSREPTIDEKRPYHSSTWSNVSDAPSCMRPAPITPKYSIDVDASADWSQHQGGTPHAPSQNKKKKQAPGHRRSISQAPEPLPKTDPWRKETGWNLTGCLVYTLFLAAYVFYFYVRIRYTMKGGILWYSIFVLIFEMIASSSMLVHGLSLLRVRLPRKSNEPVPPQEYIVRVLIPCYTESLEIVAQTVLAAANADLPSKACRTVYLLDDGKDAAKAAWVAEQGRQDIIYISGRVRAKNETNGKACNLNNTLHQLYPKDVPVDDCELVVIFDADMVCYRNFFVKILAELYDPQVAIVLTPQKFHNYDPECDIFNHSNLIYWQVSLPGLDGWDNVSCTGTNFVIRARAAQEAGWFPTYTLGEDMALALEVQKEGWKGAYVQEYLAIGEVPETIRNTFMQKSRWCKGGMQIFLSKHNAALARNLGIMQRIVWNTSGWSYICTTLTTPVFLVIPMIGVWAGYFPLQFNWWFALAFTIYSPCCYLLLYYCHSFSHLRSIYFSIVAAHMFWWAYTKATFNTIIATLANREIKFKTTEKSILSDNVTDEANKAKVQSKKKNSPLRHAWSKVQDIWIHMFTLFLCLASMAAAVYQLITTFDPNSYRSISALVSIGWLLYNSLAPAMLVWYCTFGNKGLTNLCTFIAALTTVTLLAIVIIIWLVLPNEYDWKDLLRSSLSFYDAQKSGPLPASNPIPWRGDSGLTDGVVGGFYNDGGFVKNSFSLAATVAMLALAQINFPGGFQSAGATQHGQDVLRWGSDYLLNCYQGNSTAAGVQYVAQVGSFLIDGQTWDRPERMNMSRPVYLVNNTTPASDLYGSSAAALAASAIVFKTSDPEYSTKLANLATVLYRAGVDPDNQGIYSLSILDSALGYPSSTFYDDLAWGAAWLYKLTEDPAYLQDAQKWFQASQNDSAYDPKTPLAWNWDNQLPGVALLLSEFSQWKDTAVVSPLTAFLDAWRFANTDIGVERTGSYLSYVGSDGPIRNVANAAFLARLYDQMDGNKKQYSCWSEFEARAIVGDGLQAYIVGTNKNSPTHAQHKAASCGGALDTPCPADAKWNTENNPHVLKGALVNGPVIPVDSAFKDNRLEPDTRVSIEYNAGFTGLLASLAESAPSSYTHCSQGHGFVRSIIDPGPI